MIMCVRRSLRCAWSLRLGDKQGSKEEARKERKGGRKGVKFTFLEMRQMPTRVLDDLVDHVPDAEHDRVDAQR